MTKSIDKINQATDEPSAPEPTTQVDGSGGGPQPPAPAPPMAPSNDEGRDDPLDLSKLRISQDFTARVGVKKIITTVPCRKPNRQDFVRVRSGAEWQLETAVYEDKVCRETYLVNRNLHSELMTEISAVCLFTAITRQGDVFLWPTKLPGTDGRTNAWNESALAAARRAETRWIRMAANMNAGSYDTFEASGVLTEPDWPEITLQGLVRICFQGRYIDDQNHPVLRALRGEV